ncbi:MAG: filamentous hemagglutinin N-terminal domain-containing protein [Desulfococcaceae bacterium]
MKMMPLTVSFQKFFAVPVLAAVFFLVRAFFLPISSADVVTDGTVGPAQSLNGPDYQISHDLGKTAGQNLFHSFQKFSVFTGESATFTGPDSIENVISRVTGGEISTIDGLLRSQVGHADFFFINPSGVVFGPNAKVDVPAAFHVSTADELRFADGNVFSASNPNASTLTAANPESFGYLSPQPASIILNGSRLEFAPESKVSFTGGDVSISGTADQKAELVSEGGEIRITAMGVQTGQVPVSGKADTEMKGKLTLESAAVEASGNGGGYILIQAGEAETENTGMAANNTGSKDADGGIDLLINGNLTLTQETFVQSGALGEGDSGGIRITADGFLHLKNGSEIAVYTESAGNSGNLDIRAGNMQTEDSIFLSAALSDAKGNAGNISIQTNDLILKGSNDQLTGILNQSQYGSFDDAGTVEVRADGLLEICNGAEISGGTFSEGNAGSVKIQAGEIRIDGQGSDLLTGISCSAEPESAGNAGTVEVTADGLLEMIKGAQILSSTFSEGNAGSVKIRAGVIRIDGQGADLFTGISSSAEPESGGDAGIVEVTADGLLEMINGAEISSNTFSQGSAGGVTVRAGEIRIDGHGSDEFTGIASSANSGSEGDAGTVDVTVEGLLEMINGAEISSSTFSQGSAGSVKIQSGEIRIDGHGSDEFTGISTSANSGSAGDAGTVEIRADELLEMSSGAQILSSTFSQGSAGSVTVHSGKIRINGHGSDEFTGIASSANSGSEGDAGTVDVTVEGLLKIINGAEISSNTFSQGNAGSVKIHAGAIRIDGQGSDEFTGIASSAEAESAGNAGTVDVTVEGLLEMINGAKISSSTSSAGKAGNVTVRAGNIRIDSSDAEYSAGISSSAKSGSSGDAGIVMVRTAGLLEMINGADISSDTFSQGNAGSVTVHAGEIRICGQNSDLFTGISSLATSGSAGNAGTVDVTVDGLLEMIDGATISSSTSSAGHAGNVTIHAGEIRMDGQGSEQFTGISSSAFSGTGNAGSVEVTAQGFMEICNGAVVRSNTFSEGSAGSVKIQAGAMKIDAGGLGEFTGISTSANSGSQGDGGTVEVLVEGILEMINGADISSDTFSSGSAGNVTVRAGAIRMDDQGSDQFTGISSLAASGSAGDAGTVEITVKNLLEMSNGSVISSSTSSAGKAGNVKIQAGAIRMYNQIEGQVTGIASSANSGSAGDAGTVQVTADGLLEMCGGAQILSSTFSQGNAGSVNIQAGTIRIDDQNSDRFTGIASSANSGSAGDAGTVEVTADGVLEMISGAQILSSTFSEGRAGSVRVHAGKIKIEGQDSEQFTGIASSANYGSAGDAGTVEVTADGILEVFSGAQILSSTFSKGNAGTVTVHGGEIRMEGQDSFQLTGIASSAEWGSSGDAGSVEVSADGLLEMRSGAQIQSSTFSQGRAGSVTVHAGEIRMDGQDADQITGIASSANYGSTGDAGFVEVTADGTLEMRREAQIQSATFSEGNAGSVTVHAGEIRMDGQDSYLLTGIGSSAETGSSGNAGTVDIKADGLLEMLNGAGITSSTYSLGNAGSVMIQAKQIRMENFSAVSSCAGSYSLGNASTVDMTAEELMEISNGSQITSSAYSGSLGSAGNVRIKAGELLIDGSASESFTGISSLVQDSAFGYVGSVEISADRVTVKNSGEISIAANQTLAEEALRDIPDASIQIDTKHLHLDRNARITAESTGNVPAASIHVQANEIVAENSSRITTSSNEADGGPISVQGDTLILRDSLVTTSVEGSAGNGGNITISGPADVLVFDGGFIQANTAAENARGGDIFIDAKAVIANGDSLEVGGADRQIFASGSGLNIIQAAAPGGEQGSIRITAPDLDISGALISISSGFTIPITLADDPCRAAAGEGTSSLVHAGRGGLPPGPDEPAAIFFTEERLKRILQLGDE